MKSKIPKDKDNVLQLDQKKRKKKRKENQGVFTTVTTDEKNGQMEIRENTSSSSKKNIPPVPFLCQRKLIFVASAIAEIILQVALQDRKHNITQKLNSGVINIHEVLNEVVALEVIGDEGMEKILVSIDVKKLAEFTEPL